MKTSSDYKNASLGCLRGNWAPAVLATAVYLLIALSVYSGNNIDGFSKILPKLAFFNGASAALKLVENGDGFTMFDGAPVLQNCVKLDNQLLIDYITETLGGVIGAEYGEPGGQGRIVITE